MTVSNEKFDYILKHRVWKHSFNIAVTSQNNPIERIFESMCIIKEKKFLYIKPNNIQFLFLPKSDLNELRQPAPEAPE